MTWAKACWETETKGILMSANYLRAKHGTGAHTGQTNQ